jgi:hypothetical protein
MKKRTKLAGFFLLALFSFSLFSCLLVTVSDSNRDRDHHDRDDRNEHHDDNHDRDNRH